MVSKILGAIDGIHITIDRPSDDPDSYIDRNKNCSIHLQGLVNHEKKFIDVFVGFPGSVHDARVFKESDLFNCLPEYCTDWYLIITCGSCFIRVKLRLRQKLMRENLLKIM